MRQREALIRELLDSDDVLRWLQGWFYAMCDGDWEHGYGPKISTHDNPGWGFEQNWLDTGLEDVPFQKIQIERSEHDWIICHLRDGYFKAAGGPLNLGEILMIFRHWAEPHLEIRNFPDIDAREEHQ